MTRWGEREDKRKTGDFFFNIDQTLLKLEDKFGQAYANYFDFKGGGIIIGSGYRPPDESLGRIIWADHSVFVENPIHEFLYPNVDLFLVIYRIFRCKL